MRQTAHHPILPGHSGKGATAKKRSPKIIERLGKGNSRGNHVHWSSAMVWLKSRAANASRGSP
jgi:hypothetical protein